MAAGPKDVLFDRYENSRRLCLPLRCGVWRYHHRRVGVEVDNSIGHRDGLTTVDAERFLWTSLWAGHGVARWNPATGELVAKVECPAANVTCLVFGGPNLAAACFPTAQNGGN